MNFSKVTQAATSVCALLVCSGAIAQSQFSIPNPLIKPAAREAVPSTALPPVKMVDPTNSAGGSGKDVMAPLPEPMSSKAGSAGSRSEDAVAERLSLYTVTAILGNVAVLRTNVGAPTVATPAPGTGGTGQSATTDMGLGVTQPGQAQGAQQGRQLRQQILRIRSGEPFHFHGTKVTPSIKGSQVDFVVGDGQSSVVTVALESHSSHVYALPQNAREAVDPNVATRVAPSTGPKNTIGASVSQSSSTPAMQNGIGTSTPALSPR